MQYPTSVNSMHSCLPRITHSYVSSNRLKFWEYLLLMVHYKIDHSKITAIQALAVLTKCRHLSLWRTLLINGNDSIGYAVSHAIASDEPEVFSMEILTVEALV